MYDFPAFNRVKTCRYGTMAYNLNDKYVGRSLDLYGEFSEGEVEIFRELVGPADLVLDVGANIGAHTLFFARQVGPPGRVLAFEPQRIVFQTLCANMALNSLTNVWCYPCALGAAPGQITVPPLDYTKTGNFGGLSLGGTTGEEVPVLTIDGLKLPRCRLIKLDVEGAEERVLRGAVQTLARERPFLYVENDRKDRSASLIRFIASQGYHMAWHKPRLFNPANQAGNANNVFGTIVSINMLCVPQSESWRLKGLTPVEIPPG
jgi:FkbM family methyltransferase